MISGRPGGEHLSGSVKHTHGNRDTLTHILVSPVALDRVAVDKTV